MVTQPNYHESEIYSEQLLSVKCKNINYSAGEEGDGIVCLVKVKVDLVFLIIGNYI